MESTSKAEKFKRFGARAAPRSSPPPAESPHDRYDAQDLCERTVLSWPGSRARAEGARVAGVLSRDPAMEATEKVN